MSRHPVAYKLDCDFTGQVGTSCELHMNPWSGWGNIRWSGTAPMTLPNPVVYRVRSRKVHSTTDYPSTFGLEAVFTRRMLDALLSVKPFGYRLYPVELRIGRSVIQPPSEALTYWLVQLTEHFHGFDPERSDWEPHERLPWYIDQLYRLELNVPPEGLPPIFRLPQQPTTLFVSADGRDALLDAGIRGVAFISCLELESQRMKEARIRDGVYRPPPTTHPS